MITICIPCFNQGEYLADAIESALAQTVPCEIVVVNDGSTDYTQRLAEGYQKKHGIKLINQVNKGLSSARNTGIMNMTGDYFLPLDADDILLETCVEKMEVAIREHKADVIAPSFRAFGTQNGDVVLSQIPSLKDFVSANRIPYFSAIKKEVLLEIGGYSPRMKWGWEDYHLWLDVFKRGHTLCLLSDVLVLYRTKEESMYTESLKHSDELLAQMIKDHPQIYDAA